MRKNYKAQIDVLEDALNQAVASFQLLESFDGDPVFDAFAEICEYVLN
ncbi:hypothetical protein P4E94_12710 [Pontiellaceae bacterium B12219]|nr:hypothetical protein [Pontiellaceae bacterium B12219]